MKRIFLLGFLIGLLMTLVVSATASASTLIYSNADLGTFSSGSFPIALNGLAAHTRISVQFDLYIYDSWDGSVSGCCGPDYFGFSVNGNDHRWTFSNFNPNTTNETNTVVATTTRDFNGIVTWGNIDRYFENYGGGFTFSDSSSTLNLNFYDLGLQGLTDESWSVKNVKIYSNATASVPEPAFLPLLGLGLIAVAGIRMKIK
jgi:hypothetical protein